MRSVAKWALAMGCVLGVSGLGAASASATDVPSCAAGDLSAVEGASGAGMSQPFTTIVLTNRSGAPCVVTGYPKIVAMATKDGNQVIAVTRGRIGNISGGGPKRITLAPGSRAWFALGAATAYDPPLVTFTRVAFRVNGGVKRVTISLDATAPDGKPFPIGVTALNAGTPPKNA